MNTPILPPDRNNQVQDHYLQLPDDAPVVEHMTIPGFMRRLNYRWSMIDIERFGQRVGRTAETMHLAYMPAVDSSLGVLRSFPVPMLRRVYEVMGPAFGWPSLPPVSAPAQTPESERRAALKIQGIMASQLRTMAHSAVESDVRAAARTLLVIVEREFGALQAEVGE